MPANTPRDSTDVHEACPKPGSPEYDIFVKEQAQTALFDACNGHWILRILSTLLIIFIGGGYLFSAWANLLSLPWWKGTLIALLYIVLSVGIFSYLKHSWGKRRRGYR